MTYAELKAHGEELGALVMSFADNCRDLYYKNKQLESEVARLEHAFASVSKQYRRALEVNASTERVLAKVQEWQRVAPSDYAETLQRAEQAEKRGRALETERDFYREEFVAIKKEHPPPKNERQTDTEELGSPNWGRKKSKC